MTAAKRGVCRCCADALEAPFLDLGMSPLSNVYPGADRLDAEEIFYPLRVHFCKRCFLAQIQEFEKPAQLFSDYPYFSSFSTSWLKHAERFARDMVKRFGLTGHSHVVEVASNDGYLLRYFKAQGIPVLGVEPAANVAEAARTQGIPTVMRFFGKDTALALKAEAGTADLLVCNNVLAHVPDLHDFVEGLRVLLSPGGVITLEFPHLLQLLAQTQFDTVYHEHFSYFSLMALTKIFTVHGLEVFDVEECPTHGGSLRVFVAHSMDKGQPRRDAVANLLEREMVAGLSRPETYTLFSRRVGNVKRRLLELLISLKDEGKSISAYGAAAKGNTLLNYCGLRTDFIDRVFDRNPVKQGRFTPGTRIPIGSPDQMGAFKPDYVLILPWNLEKEIIDQLAFIRSWGGQFILPIPEPRILA